MKIEVELTKIFPEEWLAINMNGRLLASGESRERVFNLSAAAGEPAPRIIKASRFPGYPLYDLKVTSEGKYTNYIINEEEKKRLFDDGLSSISSTTLKG